MPANFNEPNQIVFRTLVAVLKAAKWIEDNYEHPFRSVNLRSQHPSTSLMKPAAEKFESFPEYSFSPNKFPYVANIDSKKYPIETLAKLYKIT